MKRKDTQTYQMLTSVVAFLKHNVSLFPNTSSRILTTIESEVTSLGELLVQNTSAITAVRVTRLARDSAYESLKAELLGASQLAQALHNEKYRMPLSTGRPALINSARAFLQDVPSMKEEFVEHGFPADFADQLAVKTRELERTVEDFKAAIGRRSASIHKWDTVLADALDTLGRFDVVARNALRDDPAAQASYAIARTVRRLPGRKEVEITVPPQVAVATAAA
jgi:hypothetical protein